MKTALVFSVVCLLAVLSALWAAPLWQRTYNGQSNRDDEVHAIGTDDSGNVVVSGFSDLSSTDAEFVTIKYKPNGDTAWLRHFNPGNGLDGATSLAIDRRGNVIVDGYIGGSTSGYGDWAVVKYSAAGDSLWTATWNLGANDRPIQIVVDTAGNSYVTGNAGSQNYMDFAVVKFDASGNKVWQFIYDGGDNDGAAAVAVDFAGNVYATGYTVLGGNYGHLLTMKLNPAGDSLWKNIYTGPAGKTDMGSYIVVDGSGNVIVSGVSNDTAGRSDYITIKYSSNGDTLWTRRYNGPGNQADVPLGLVLDAAGNAYVTGCSYDVNNHYDYGTIKYSPDGAERWVARYPGASHQAGATAIGLDADANVYVTGTSLSASYFWGVATVKYDSAGDQRWAESYAGDSGETEAYVLAVGSSSSVYVGARMGVSNEGMDYLTLNYGAAGAVMETPNAKVRTTHAATIARGILFLPAPTFTLHSSLFSLSGQKVLDLNPGANDVSSLSPGVYFVRAAGGKLSAMNCHKVVIQK
ncbi:MAG TPA: hypothetical protein VMH22_09490 [bacterium]|nr:hypothetical protein [bacterium]